MAPGSYLAECYWPDVADADIAALEARIVASLGDGVRYVGSLLIREDEVVLFQFEGPADEIRAAAERARVPFERLLEATVANQRSPDG